MPYVDKEARKRLIDVPPENAGELNYVVTVMLDDYITRKGGPKYALLNEVIGVLECAKQELYRRVVAPYEDVKIAQNGDVYREPPAT